MNTRNFVRSIAELPTSAEAPDTDAGADDILDGLIIRARELTGTLKRENLQVLLNAARNLTEPAEPNPEYVRGQVNLIMDAWGLGLGDSAAAYELVTAAIEGKISVETAVDALLALSEREGNA
jgi:hypothetical protein